MTSINSASTLKTRAYNPFKALGYQLYCELIRLLRNPGFLIPTLFFPIMFFSLFGLSGAQQDIGNGVKLGAYLLASYGTYGTLSAALLGFGVGIAAERGLGWNRLTRGDTHAPAFVLWCQDHDRHDFWFGDTDLIIRFRFCGGKHFFTARDLAAVNWTLTDRHDAFRGTRFIYRLFGQPNFCRTDHAIDFLTDVVRFRNFLADQSIAKICPRHRAVLARLSQRSTRLAHFKRWR